MIASLPMYDRPETREAYIRLWARIQADLPELPRHLSHPANPWDHWLSPDLALSQSCGLPFRTRLHGHVHLVGTPDYALPGCPPGHYCSVLVMRLDDPRRALEHWPDLTLAVNSFDSQSGWAAPHIFAKTQGVAFNATHETGSHSASVCAVAKGRADIAAIDAQSWRMITRWDDTSALTEIARTPPTPGLPLVTAKADLVPSLRNTIRHHIATLPEADREILDLQGLIDIPADDYLAVPTPD